MQTYNERLAAQLQRLNYQAVTERENSANELAAALVWILDEIGDITNPQRPSVEAMENALSVLETV